MIITSKVTLEDIATNVRSTYFEITENVSIESGGKLLIPSGAFVLFLDCKIHVRGGELIIGNIDLPMTTILRFEGKNSSYGRDPYRGDNAFLVSGTLKMFYCSIYIESINRSDLDFVSGILTLQFCNFKCNGSYNHFLVSTGSTIESVNMIGAISAFEFLESPEFMNNLGSYNSQYAVSSYGNPVKGYSEFNSLLSVNNNFLIKNNIPAVFVDPQVTGDFYKSRQSSVLIKYTVKDYFVGYDLPPSEIKYFNPEQATADFTLGDFIQAEPNDLIYFYNEFGDGEEGTYQDISTSSYKYYRDYQTVVISGDGRSESILKSLIIANKGGNHEYLGSCIKQYFCNTSNELINIEFTPEYGLEDVHYSPRSGSDSVPQDVTGITDITNKTNKILLEIKNLTARMNAVDSPSNNVRVQFNSIKRCDGF